MDLAKEQRGFLDHLRVERGLSQNTISAYERDLKSFASFLTDSTVAFEDVTAETVLAYRVYLGDKRYSQASVSRMLSSLRSFYKYLSKEKGHIDPTTELEKFPVMRRLPKALTISQTVALIDASFHSGNPITLRDRALLELLYGSGARVSEIVGVDVGDLHRFQGDGVESETIKLRGKGGKERIVPLGSYASAAVSDYMTRIRPELLKKSPKATSALFLNQRGTRLSRQSAWQIVLDAAKSAGIDSHVSPHVFRHSYATHLLDGGADIRVVQELLGHASVTTTQIYTLITIDKVRETYSLAHPRARD